MDGGGCILQKDKIMREIEVKLQVKDKQKLLENLQKKGIILGESLTQHDEVFGEKDWQENPLSKAWLRIRTQNENTIYFTFKRSVVGHLDSIEHEVQVDNKHELKALIMELGFVPYSDLTKMRQKAQYGEMEICVDEIPSLGVFIEVEMLMDIASDHDKVVDEIWHFILSLGLSKEDEVHEGYDVLERRKRGLVN
jgi:adenylate cyclase, class 2